MASNARAPAAVPGPRANSRRRAAALAVLILGILGVMAVGMLLQRPVLQVYWAIYARAHPMRDYISSTGWTQKVRESTAEKVDAILKAHEAPDTTTSVPQATAESKTAAYTAMQKNMETFAAKQAKEMRDKRVPFATPGALSTPMDIDDSSSSSSSSSPTADAASSKAAALLQRAKGLSEKAALANAEKTAIQSKKDHQTRACQMEERVKAMIASGRYDESMKMERKTNDEVAVRRALELEAGDPEGHRNLERMGEMGEALGRWEKQKAASAKGAAASTAYTGNSADYKLNRDMVARVAVDNTVMVTWANLHYLDFVINWVEHVRGLGITSYLVGAMDDDILKALVAKGVNTFAMGSGLSLGDFGWGSPTFHKMGREKINLIELFTSMGFNILVSDVDTVWLQNPYPYIAQFPDADILTSSDLLMETSCNGQLEYWPRAGAAANIGIMLFRTTAINLAKEWNKLLESDSKIWDQNAFNDLFRRGLTFNESRTDNLIDCYDNKLKIGILPVAQFCSGHTFFTQRMNERLGLDAYVVHATFQFSGTPGKRHRMRERLLWASDGPEYYDPPGGFLTWQMDWGGLLSKSGPTELDYVLPSKIGHFNLVNHELVQIRHAWAIAGALGRTLVFPELYCGMDRYWAAHDGLIPGSKFGVPFICPLDHILDLEQMDKDLPESSLGPNVRYREHSLFYNPRMPAAVRDDKLTIHVCQEGEEGCADGSGPATESGGVVRLRPRLNDVQIKTALTPFSARKILDFTSMVPTFAGFAEHQNAVKFEQRLKVYSSIWCCVLAHPGHVWYDFFWDQMPHTDRHNRLIDKPWEPTTGP